MFPGVSWEQQSKSSVRSNPRSTNARAYGTPIIQQGTRLASSRDTEYMVHVAIWACSDLVFNNSTPKTMGDPQLSRSSTHDVLSRIVRVKRLKCAQAYTGSLLWIFSLQQNRDLVDVHWIPISSSVTNSWSATEDSLHYVRKTAGSHWDNRSTPPTFILGVDSRSFKLVCAKEGWHQPIQR